MLTPSVANGRSERGNDAAIDCTRRNISRGLILSRYVWEEKVEGRMMELGLPTSLYPRRDFAQLLLILRAMHHWQGSQGFQLRQPSERDKRTDDTVSSSSGSACPLYPLIVSDSFSLSLVKRLPDRSSIVDKISRDQVIIRVCLSIDYLRCLAFKLQSRISRGYREAILMPFLAVGSI
jgi:hypothetical protein